MSSYISVNWPLTMLHNMFQYLYIYTLYIHFIYTLYYIYHIMYIECTYIIMYVCVYIYIHTVCTNQNDYVKLGIHHSVGKKIITPNFFDW